MRDITTITSVLNSTNIDRATKEYFSLIKDLRGLPSKLKGVEFFQYLKRKKTGTGPYPKCTVFETANRIMTDLVILKGVKWLIDCKNIPFTEFNVDYGNANNYEHDIIATNNGLKFCGEAFNVAPSFFMGKKTRSLKKLREKSSDANFRFIVANIDAVENSYTPKKVDGEYYLFVDISSDDVLFHHI